VSNVTVMDIVDQYLRANGFDGLFSDNGKCGCVVDDLAPCGELQQDCRAGYMMVGCDCGEGHDYHIVADQEYAKSGTARRDDDE